MCYLITSSQAPSSSLFHFQRPCSTLSLSRQLLGSSNPQYSHFLSRWPFKPNRQITNQRTTFSENLTAITNKLASSLLSSSTIAPPRDAPNVYCSNTDRFSTFIAIFVIMSPINAKWHTREQLAFYTGRKGTKRKNWLNCWYSNP